jgi:hypothetical protein
MLFPTKKIIACIGMLAFSAIAFADGSYATHKIGDVYGGGVVFYVYDFPNPGDTTSGLHGLIMSKADQRNGTVWATGSALTQNILTGDVVGNGKTNTVQIIAAVQNGGPVTDGVDYAATWCAFYISPSDMSPPGGEVYYYSDWYLPSVDELREIYRACKTKNFPGAAHCPIDGYYWSSSEPPCSNDKAFAISFTDGKGILAAKSSKNRVRAIRSF